MDNTRIITGGVVIDITPSHDNNVAAPAPTQCECNARQTHLERENAALRTRTMSQRHELARLHYVISNLIQTGKKTSPSNTGTEPTLGLKLDVAPVNACAEVPLPKSDVAELPMEPLLLTWETAQWMRPQHGNQILCVHFTVHSVHNLPTTPVFGAFVPNNYLPPLPPTLARVAQLYHPDIQKELGQYFDMTNALPVDKAVVWAKRIVQRVAPRCFEKYWISKATYYAGIRKDLRHIYDCRRLDNNYGRESEVEARSEKP